MEVQAHMKRLTIGLVVLIAALVLTAGAVTAHGMAGAVNDGSEETDEMPTDEQQEECEEMMGEMDNCSMADGGMMDMMHGDGMEECQEMMGDEMTDEMMEECQEMMSDGGMMDGNESGMGCH